MSEKKKILIVDDEPFLRETIAEILSSEYDVTRAPDGRIAKQLIALTQFDLILSDFQMPFLNGVELLEWVKATLPTKFILMTSFSHLLENKAAGDLGADDLITKPFREKDLQEKISKLLKPESTEPKIIVGSLDHEYCKVPIEDFITDKEFKFDFFLRLNSEKYLKIAHKGTRIQWDRMQVYKDHHISFLYVHKNDFIKLANFTLQFSKLVVGSNQIDQEKKDRFMRYTGEVVLENSYVNGLNRDSFELAKNYTHLSLKTLVEEPRIFQLISSLNDHADFLYAHSLAVSTFSVMIARAMGWSRTAILFKLSMAGLFHDIGKKEISKEILSKSRSELSYAERELVETHPFRGREILNSVEGMPDEIATVAFEHHENIIRTGYPRRPEKRLLHPLTLVVSAANVFANYTIKNPKTPIAFNAAEALSKMKINYESLLEPTCFAALAKAIEVKG